MRKSLMVFIVVSFAFLMLSFFASAGTHTYIGVKKCKMCHRIEYKSWLQSKHANAWKSLKPAEQKKPKCAGCHSTKLPEYTGITCEKCHGPGSGYWKMRIMRNKKLAVQNGLILPTKETCIKCHNKKSPTFKGFNWDKMKTKVHAFKHNPFAK